MKSMIFQVRLLNLQTRAHDQIMSDGFYHSIKVTNLNEDGVTLVRILPVYYFDLKVIEAQT